MATINTRSKQLVLEVRPGEVIYIAYATDRPGIFSFEGELLPIEEIEAQTKGGYLIMVKYYDPTKGA